MNIEGRELKTLADYSNFWKEVQPTAGEPIALFIRRQGESLTIRTQCPPDAYDMFLELDKAGELSPRRSGFPCVIVHDGVLRREECGGPVVDVSGKIVGINIARAARHATYTIPTSRVTGINAKTKVITAVERVSH